MAVTLLEVQQVTKRFGGFQALTEVSLQVGQGECLGLIGPNGSGKTTLINCISGVLRTDGGSMRFHDTDITTLLSLMPAVRSPRAHQRRLCITPQWREPTLAHRIVLTDVEAGYGAVRVLHRVSIEVREGETVALLGTNGNGKSTLMKCIMGWCQWMLARCFWKLTASASTCAGSPRKPLCI